MANTVNPFSVARYCVNRCFISKNSLVPCVPSPSDTMRASPTIDANVDAKTHHLSRHSCPWKDGRHTAKRVC